MRITTLMLDRSIAKTGLPIQRSSLLDYLNNTASDNTLLSALGKNGSAGSSLSKKNYEKLKDAADTLGDQTGALTAEGRDAIFEKLKNDGDREELNNTVEKLVSSYNSTMDSLLSTNNTLNIYYYQMMGEMATESKDELASIGIQVGKDGKLSIDKEKFEAADIESIEKVLGASGSFTQKADFLAGRIASNAKANVESLSTQYNSSGSSYAEILSRYDVRR